MIRITRRERFNAVHRLLLPKYSDEKNLAVDFMQGKLVSTENLAVGIWQVPESYVESLSIHIHNIKVLEY